MIRVGNLRRMQSLIMHIKIKFTQKLWTVGIFNVIRNAEWVKARSESHRSWVHSFLAPDVWVKLLLVAPSQVDQESCGGWTGGSFSKKRKWGVLNRKKVKRYYLSKSIKYVFLSEKFWSCPFFLNLPSLANFYPIKGLSGTTTTTTTTTFWQFANL